MAVLLPILFLVMAILVAVAWFIGQPWLQRRRRLALAARPFPEQWQRWLRERTTL